MTGSDWVSLLGVIVWPLSVLVAVLVLRRPIGDLFRGVGDRITSVSVASVSIELAVPVDPPWVGMQGADARGLVAASEVNDSYFDSLRQSLWSSERADYFVVDLKSSGSSQWLTSRLYLFTWVLSRMKGIRAVVFVATRGDVARSFVGVAAANRLTLALEDSEPWLRLARWEAETEQLVKPLPPNRSELRRWQQPPGAADKQPDPHPRCACCLQQLPAAQITSTQPSPPLDVEEWWRIAASATGWRPEDPLAMASSFARAIQWSQPSGAPDPAAGWLRLPPSTDNPAADPIWEHTRWVTLPELIDGALRDVIVPDSSVTNNRSWSKQDRAIEIARAGDDFVALITSAGRFETLVDRHALLQSIGMTAAEG
jgi:hypothetical protein